jgi:RHS repeat-associated protein
MTVAGQQSVTYSFDDADRLTGLTRDTLSVSMSYDDVNRRTTLTLPNGIVTQYGYDDANELTSVTYQDGATTLGDLSYTYDTAGRRIQVGGSWARTGLPQAITSATYDAANELIAWGAQTPQYDANGSLTSNGLTTYSWNARERLDGTSGASSTQFQYDAVGRRTAATINGTATEYLYDDLNSIRQTQGGQSISLLAGENLDEWFAETHSADSASFLSDPLGSVIATADATGAIVSQRTYEPFGREATVGEDVGNPIAYAGREFDAGSLYYYRNRYYAADVGRFISEDPMGLVSGVDLFKYAEDDPIDRSDPTGLDSTSEYCQRLREKIDNVKQRIGRRQGQIDENPQNLPESCPGDQQKPSTSRRGHRRLINQDKALLAWLEVQYFLYCTDPPAPPRTPPIPAPTPQQTTVIGAVGAALLVLILSPVGG